MDTNFFLFLLEEEELKGYFSKWPDHMLVAVSADVDEGFSLILYRQEEAEAVLQRIAESKNLSASELHIIPKVKSYPTMNILFSQEQEIVTMVRNDPDILEAAEDYSVNYQYAIDEGKSPSFSLPEDKPDENSEELVDEVADEALEEVSVTVEEDTVEDETVPTESDDDVVDEPVADDVVADVDDEEVDPEIIEEAPASPVEQDTKIENGQKEVSPSTSPTPSAPAEPEEDPTSGFIPVDVASKLRNKQVFGKFVGSKVSIAPQEVSISTGPAKASRNVLVKEDFSSILILASDKSETSKMLDEGFVFEIDGIPSAVLENLFSDKDAWNKVRLIEHKAGVLISAVAGGGAVVQNQVIQSTRKADEVKEPAKRKSFLTHLLCAACGIAITFALVPGMGIPSIFQTSRPESVEISASQEEIYMESLRSKIFESQ